MEEDFIANAFLKKIYRRIFNQPVKYKVNFVDVYPEEQELAKAVLDLLTRAPHLLHLTRDETNEVLYKIQDFHGKAYGWTPDLTLPTLVESTQSGGYLLRTKIRAAIDLLNQLYQYNKVGKTTINELGRKTLEEDVPSLEEFSEKGERIQDC